MSGNNAGQDAHRVLPEYKAARFCGINPSTWRRMLARGETPAPFQLSPRRRGYRVGNLERWMSERQVPSVAPPEGEMMDMIIEPAGKRLADWNRAEIRAAAVFFLKERIRAEQEEQKLKVYLRVLAAGGQRA